MNRKAKWMSIGILSAHFVASGMAAVRPVETTLDLPPIWNEAGAQARLAATRVAEVDAARQLTERIYGILLAAATDIDRFVMDRDEISGSLDRVVRGIRTTEQPEYLPDGRVELVRAIKLRQVLETITTEITQNRELGRWVTVTNITTLSRQNHDTVVEVMGNGALPDSLGLGRIQAKRAAEMDAYRKLAERVMGVRITARTTVRDFVLESETVRARLVSQVLKGAKPVAIRYIGEDACEVTMELKLADLYEVISRTVRGNTEIEEIARTAEITTLTETGRGAVADIAPQDAVSAATIAMEPQVQTRQIETVIKRLVGTGVVIE